MLCSTASPIALRIPAAIECFLKRHQAAGVYTDPATPMTRPVKGGR